MKIKTGDKSNLNLKIFIENLASCNGFDEDIKCKLFNTDFEIGFWDIQDAKNYYIHNRKQLQSEWQFAYGDQNEHIF